MTSRERMAALLRRETPDRMGLYEHFWGETLPAWITQGYPEGQSPEALFDYDLRPLGWLDTTPFRGVDELIQETDEWRVARNGRGAVHKSWKAKSGTPEHIAFDCDTPEKWKKYREPLLQFDPERLDLDNNRAALEAGHEAGKFVTLCNVFVFELLRGTLGDVIFMESTLTHPEWIHDFCQVHLDFFKAHYGATFDAGVLPDGMFIYEDLGYTNGTFCSPKSLRELILPYYKELVGFFHSYGLPVILHTCGGITKAVPIIVEAGFDCLQPMEAKAGCDVREYAREFGDQISFMGNIDVTVLNTNDKDKVREEVTSKVTALKQMGASYTFHSDHSIPPDVHYDTYKFAVELFRELGDY